VASGEAWSRPPTRWLKGLDGVRDFSYGLYVHETSAPDVLAAHAGKPLAAAAAAPGYARDVVERGADMGLLLAVRLERDLPLEAARDAWGGRLAASLARRAAAAGRLPAPGGNGLASLAALRGIFEPSRLAGETSLVAPLPGRRDGALALRAGSRLLFCTAPGGRLVVEAASPEPLARQGHYLLGGLESPELCAALLELFVGDAAADGAFAARARGALLAFANGFRHGNPDANGDIIYRGAPPAYAVDRVAARPRVFALPPVGARPAPTLMTNVQTGVRMGLMAAAAREAAAAAARVPRGAAAQALRAAMSAVGLDDGGVDWAALSAPLAAADAGDVAAAAAPLAGR
jgi:hypothetical protein